MIKPSFQPQYTTQYLLVKTNSHTTNSNKSYPTRVRRSTSPVTVGEQHTYTPTQTYYLQWGEGSLLESIPIMNDKSESNVLASSENAVSTGNNTLNTENVGSLVDNFAKNNGVIIQNVSTIISASSTSYANEQIDMNAIVCSSDTESGISGEEEKSLDNSKNQNFEPEFQRGFSLGSDGIIRSRLISNSTSNTAEMSKNAEKSNSSRIGKTTPQLPSVLTPEHLNQRMNEKDKLINLNNRFANYIDNVRKLEFRNRELESEISRSQTQTPRVYKDELQKLRNEVNDLKTTQERDELDHENLITNVRVWKGKFENELHGGFPITK